MGTVWKEQADNAKSRSDIYGLLSAVFREEPAEALVNELRGPRFSGAFSEMGVELGEKFYGESAAEVTEQLAFEFTRLFIGPGPHISAHESIFVEVDDGVGGLWGEQTVAVKKFIETTGLSYDPGFTGIPDHVSVELEFMRKLTAWEAGKWEEGDNKNAEYCLSVQRMFLEKHLLRWLPGFCDAVIAKAEMPFYRAMAELTKQYADFEQQNIVTESAA